MIVCDAKTLNVEARVVNVNGVELKPLVDIQETGAVQGRTGTLEQAGASGRARLAQVGGSWQRCAVACLGGLPARATTAPAPTVAQP